MKQEEEATQLRNDLQNRREEGTARGRGYPMVVRARVLAYTAECRKRRETVQTVADRLGMSSSTLSMWIKAEQRRETASVAPAGESRFAAVKVPVSGRIKLVSPSGWSVEIGFDVLAALVAGRK